MGKDNRDRENQIKNTKLGIRGRNGAESNKNFSSMV